MDFYSRHHQVFWTRNGRWKSVQQILSKKFKVCFVVKPTAGLNLYFEECTMYSPQLLLYNLSCEVGYLSYKFQIVLCTVYSVCCTLDLNLYLDNLQYVGSSICLPCTFWYPWHILHLQVPFACLGPLCTICQLWI